MLKKFELYLEKTIFNSRWILAPFYLGLVLGIILLFLDSTLKCNAPEARFYLKRCSKP